MRRNRFFQIFSCSGFIHPCIGHHNQIHHDAWKLCAATNLCIEITIRRETAINISRCQESLEIYS